MLTTLVIIAWTIGVIIVTAANHGAKKASRSWTDY